VRILRLMSSIFSLAGLAATLAHGTTQVALTIGVTSVGYAEGISLTARVVTDVGTCSAPGEHGRVTIERDGVPLPHVAGDWYSPFSGCSGGVYTLDETTSLYDTPFGTHQIVAAYTPEGASEPVARSTSVAVSVTPQVAVQIASSGAMVRAGIMNPRPNAIMGWYCSSANVQVNPTSDVPPPGGSHFPYGNVRYASGPCSFAGRRTPLRRHVRLPRRR
jgi:hypothetical protein